MQQKDWVIYGMSAQDSSAIWQTALLGKLRLGSIHKTLALSRSEIIVIQLKTFIIGLAPYKSIFLTHPHQANPRAHVQLSSYFYKKFEIFANSIFKMF